jgi:hypothetical protein
MVRRFDQQTAPRRRQMLRVKRMGVEDLGQLLDGRVDKQHLCIAADIAIIDNQTIKRTYAKMKSIFVEVFLIIHVVAR